MKRALSWGKGDGTKVGSSRQEAVLSGAWRTGSFKPVGDGSEDEVLFCRQTASALF